MKKELYILVILTSLLVSLIPIVTAGSFNTPYPNDSDQDVFYRLNNTGVKVNLSIVWSGSGSTTITFFWGNGSIIGTDVVGNGEKAEVITDWLNFTTSYNWYVEDDTGSSSSVYSFVTSDVFSTHRDWKNASNPVISRGGAGSWDELNIEGTAAMFDPVSNEFKIFYTGDPSGGFGTFDDIGLVNVTDLRNASTYVKCSSNPILSDNSIKANCMSIVDNRNITAGTGAVYLYVGDESANLDLYTCTDNSFVNFTKAHENIITSSSYAGVEKLDDTHWIMYTQSNELFYSSDGINWGNRETGVLSYSWWSWNCNDFNTPEVFTTYGNTSSKRVYISFEDCPGTCPDMCDYVNGFAWCNYSDLIDGDYSSSWQAANNGDPVIEYNGQAWDPLFAEIKTYYMPRGDPDRIYSFIEGSSCDNSDSEIGCYYTKVFTADGNTSGNSSDEVIVYIRNINGLKNNSYTDEIISSFNWTKANNATYYVLQIANDSLFTDIFVNLSDINESNYAADYDEKGNYVEFTLPSAYRKDWYGDYYFRVKAVVYV